MLLLLLPFVVSVYSQQAGTLQAEVHPPLTWESCTGAEVCTTVTGSVTLDADWRWAHAVGSDINCYTGNTWNTTLCPDAVACAENCALEGAIYSNLGITTDGNSLALTFESPESTEADTGSRVYLLANATEYQTFNLLNKEIAFDIDVSTLDCGYSSGLYFVAMDADGGSAKHPVNTAGAKYGTGYCDASCPRDVKWINGEANIEEWTPSSADTLDTEQAGSGLWGSCCPEVDVWTSNQISTVLTVHPCLSINQTMCISTGCGGPNSTSGSCDYDGCDFNPYRLGNKAFFGPGLTVDTTKVFTVVTQFIGSPLTDIIRFYIQDGVTIPNPPSEIISVKGNSITAPYCNEELAAFKEVNSFEDFGGFASITAAFTKGMVLAFAIEGNYFGNGTQWLDGTYPLGVPATVEGAARGPCAVNQASTDPVGNNARVTFSNIRIGAINSTT